MLPVARIQSREMTGRHVPTINDEDASAGSGRGEGRVGEVHETAAFTVGSKRQLEPDV